MTERQRLFVFIGISLFTGLAIGGLFAPDGWYDQLNKPWFNPPGWIFGPVWTVLYIMIGVAGARAWGAEQSPMAMQAWGAQYLLNTMWTPFFFGLKQPAIALGIIILLLISIIAFIAVTWRNNRTASLLFIPYLAWVSFATILNAAIVQLN